MKLGTLFTTRYCLPSKMASLYFLSSFRQGQWNRNLYPAGITTSIVDSRFFLIIFSKYQSVMNQVGVDFLNLPLLNFFI